MIAALRFVAETIGFLAWMAFCLALPMFAFVAVGGHP